MSDKEAEKAFIMDRVVKGEMSAAEGARLLSVSKRHVFRLKAGIKAKGIASLVHGNRQRKVRMRSPKKSAEWCGTGERTNTEARAIPIFRNFWSATRMFISAERASGAS